MKVKPKKDSTKMFPTDHVSHGSHKGRQKESGFTDRKGDAAVALITSSSRKRMIDSGSSCLVSPTQPYTRSKGTKACLQSNDLAEDVCRDLRLAFSTIDGLPADQNGGSVAASQSCILETIFSPVFHLFKGLSGEISTSCTSSVDQADSPEEKSEAVDTREDCKSVCREISKKLSASCPTATTVTEEVILEKEIGSVPGILDEVPLLCQVEHVTIPTRAPDDEMFGTQTAFDVGDDCIAWSLLDENVARDTSQQAERMEEGLLDSDGASLYLAIQQTKPLECNDENIQSGAAPDDDEFNDFDPYLFIKHLPDLSEVVSPSRPMLLPKQTRRCPPITLVLDLDETLVHSTLEHCEDADFTFPVNFNFQEHTVYVRRRPHLQKFMERVAQMFEIIVFTASQSIYAEQLLNVLDPKRKLIRHRVFRDSCVFVEGNYLKDLTVLGRDLSKVAIVDNSPQAFGFQVDNGIPIESWFDDRSDSALSGLLPFLETLVGVDDVRPIIAKKFNLRQKIAAAMDPGSIANRGDPFERCL